MKLKLIAFTLWSWTTKGGKVKSQWLLGETAGDNRLTILGEEQALQSRYLSEHEDRIEKSSPAWD